MKKAIVLTFLMCSVLFAQDIKYRVSESKFKQKSIEFSQGGVLVRFGHQKLQRPDIGQPDTFWRCNELWVAKNTRTKKVKAFIQAKAPKLNIVSLNSIINNYQNNTKIDTTASWTKKDIIKKLSELEKRIKVLEKL